MDNSEVNFSNEQNNTFSAPTSPTPPATPTDPQTPPAPETPELPTPPEPTPPLKNPTPKNQKRILIISIIIASVILVGGLTLGIVLCLFSNSQTENTNQPTKEYSTNFQDYLTESPETAVSTFQEIIDRESDPVKKSELYKNRSEILFDNFSQDPTKKEQIISDAKAADELNPTEGSAYFVYNLYNFYNDVEPALYYSNLRHEREKLNEKS